MQLLSHKNDNVNDDLNNTQKSRQVPGTTSNSNPNRFNLEDINFSKKKGIYLLE